MQRLRAALEWALAAVLVGLWPLAVLCRWAGLRRWSLWTGRPIITLGVKARAERLLGVRALSVVTHSYFVTSAFDLQLAKTSHPKVWRYAVSWAALGVALLLAKRVHTFFDAGFLPSINRFQFNPRELWLYRVFGVQHVVWSYGADVRTRNATLALGEPNACTDCDAPGLHCVCSSQLAAANLARLARSAKLMATMGDMNEYVPHARHNLHYWPIDLDRFNATAPVPSSSQPGLERRTTLKVAHAPNHRQFKGSRYLIEAVAQLRAEGVGIELMLVERVANAQALAMYAEADLVFDQCLIGFHGYFALEAMALGKPVLAFIRKPSYLLQPDECPIIQVERDSIADVLRRCSEDRAWLARMGQKGRAYVERHYSVRAFSGRLAQAYTDIGITA